MRRLLLIALLLAAPLAAQEDVLPDGDAAESVFGDTTGSNCQTLCTAKDCSVDVDDDPTSVDGAFLGMTATASIRFTFASPTGNPDTTASAQSIELAVHKSRASGALCGAAQTGNQDSTYDLTLYCNGVSKSGTFQQAGIPLTGGSQQDTYSWTYPSGDGDCGADGATVEFEVNGACAGSASQRRCMSIDAIRWVATVSAGSRRVITVGG